MMRQLLHDLFNVHSWHNTYALRPKMGSIVRRCEMCGCRQEVSIFMRNRGDIEWHDVENQAESLIWLLSRLGVHE